MSFVLFLLFAATAAYCQPTGGAAGEVRHRFLCTDNGLGKVWIISEQGEIEWEYPAPGCQDCWRLPNGNYLFTNVRGVQEVTPAKQVVTNRSIVEGRAAPICAAFADPSGLEAPPTTIWGASSPF